MKLLLVLFAAIGTVRVVCVHKEHLVACDDDEHATVLHARVSH